MNWTEVKRKARAAGDAIKREALQRAVDQSQTRKQAAFVLGMPYETFLSNCVLLGVNVSSFSEKRGRKDSGPARQNVIQLHKAGLNGPEIASRLKCTKQNVQAHLARAKYRGQL